MRGIIVGGIAILLVLGCNNGEIEKLENKNKFLGSVVNLGNDFLSVFTSFGDIFTGTLGFKADTTKKSEVATYFKNVQSTLEKTKAALSKIVDDMKTQENPNAAGVESAVKTLIDDTLTKIMQGSKIVSDAIGSASGELLGDVTAAGGSAAGVQGKTEDLIKGIKTIVDIVLKNDQGDAEAGNDNKTENSSQQRGDSAGEAGKLFGNTSTGVIGSTPEKAAADAAKAVGAVTGADILKAIIKDDGKGDAFKLANATPTQVVSGITKSQDATIAGAIALRAMAPGGKFANGNNASGSDISTAVKGVALSAVTKALDTLTIAIRKTIDEGLKKVKEAIKS